MRISSCTMSFCTLRNHYKKKKLLAPQRKVAISLQAVPNTYIIFQSFTRQESSGECGVTSPDVSYNHHEAKRRLVFALRRSRRGKSAAFVSYLSRNAGWFVCCARGQRRQVDKKQIFAWKAHKCAVGSFSVPEEQIWGSLEGFFSLSVVLMLLIGYFSLFTVHLFVDSQET